MSFSRSLQHFFFHWASLFDKGKTTYLTPINYEREILQHPSTSHFIGRQGYDFYFKRSGQRIRKNAFHEKDLLKEGLKTGLKREVMKLLVKTEHGIFSSGLMVGEQKHLLERGRVEAFIDQFLGQLQGKPQVLSVLHTHSFRERIVKNADKHKIYLGRLSNSDCHFGKSLATSYKIPVEVVAVYRSGYNYRLTFEAL